MSLIRCTNLCYTVDDQSLVNNISLELNPGELCGIIGPNGAGKTTLLRLLAGYLRPSAGQIVLADRPLQQWSAKERAQRLAWLGQGEAGIFPFTVKELVAMGRYAHQRPFQAPSIDDQRMVLDQLDYVGLGTKANQQYTTLSAGEKQRALFAKALAQEAPILLLDEPSANLDLAQEHQLFSMLQELRSEGKSVLMVIHNLNSACEYCDRLIVLKDGRIEANGPPRELMSASNIKTWFGADTHVGHNEASGALLISHIPTPHRGPSPGRCHIIGGAGSAIASTRLLQRLGYQLSGGIAHGLDRDLSLWQSLRMDHVNVAPFAPIDRQAFDAACSMVNQADFTILCSFPFGPGNSSNLALAAQAKLLYILDDHHCPRSFFAPGLENEFVALIKDKQTGKQRHVLDWSQFQTLAIGGHLISQPRGQS
jgi:iron complex transport system ATP-binding protein